MKLAAIYNVWDGVELLRGSMECLKGEVDLFIIVWQKISNYGEKYDPLPEIIRALIKEYDIDVKTILSEYVPERIGGGFNEKAKRNEGLNYARAMGCTHFIHMDCDEYYPEFAKGKQLYIQSRSAGSVCKMFTYFKDKHYRLAEPDNYYVPFIHRLAPETVAGIKPYPFYVDHTRTINTADVVELPIMMHHYSWVRNNIERKVRNSSARVNIERSQLLADYYSPELKEGYYLKDFRQKIIAV